MTQQDLDSYKIDIRPALEGSYRDRKVYTSHAPTSGMILLHMLNIAEQIEGLVEQGRTPLNTHRIVEILKCM